MFQNASIRMKLAAVLVLPLLALTVLAGLRVRDNLSTGRQADRVHNITTFALSLTGLVNQLQLERDLSAGYAGGGTGYGQMVAARVGVNQALKEFQGKLRGIDLRAYNPRLRQSLADAQGDLGAKLNTQRNAIGASGRRPSVAVTVDFYNDLIADLLNVDARIPGDSDDRNLTATINTFVALARSVEYTSQERGLVNAALAAHRFAPGQAEQVSSVIGAEDTWVTQFQSLATPQQAAPFNRAVSDPDWNRASALRRGILPSDRAPNGGVDSKNWFQVMSAKIALLRSVTDDLAADVASASLASKTAADRQAATGTTLLAVVVAFAIVLSVLIARAMVRTLGALREAAHDIAERRLPGIVDQLQQASPEEAPVAPEAEPIGIGSRDEIGQVARAFDSIHEVAVRVATEQALLRRNIGDMFLNLARRSQSLIHRQLELIDDLEQNEADPKALDNLFRLDHLATRMRRNAENLIVLSGAEPPRRWNEPIPLSEVVRGAGAEVEDYARVAVQPLDGIGVVGPAASDVIHLLAELLENATAFSPPHTRVTVTGQHAAAGYVLQIEDAGIGIPGDELGELNQRLQDNPLVGLSLSRRMGLFVVGRLAARYNIKVRLERSFFGGVCALVLLPQAILIRLDAPGPAVRDAVVPAAPPSLVPADGHRGRDA